jgi:hypothetical protein
MTRNFGNAVRRQGGFISGMVIGILVLVSIAIMAVASGMTMQVKRTRAAAAGAQLRQLLLAAPVVARAELASGGPRQREVNVPVPAGLEGATLTLDIGPGDGAPTARMLATALMKGYKASQQLEFRQEAGGWTLQASELRETP